VGLDGDPFLASNGPILRHAAGAAKVVGTTCRVDVYTIEAGKKSPGPVTTADLAFRSGMWVFTNFHYGKDREGQDINLLGLLEGFRSQ